MTRLALFTIVAVGLACAAAAQTLNPESTTPKTVPEAPSMTSSATTMAPVEAGSTKMHAVPTPSVTSKPKATEMGVRPSTSRN